jgi:hypothetical protein
MLQVPPRSVQPVYHAAASDSGGLKKAKEKKKKIKLKQEPPLSAVNASAGNPGPGTKSLVEKEERNILLYMMMQHPPDC